MPRIALIVDDSRTIRMVLAKTLRELGYETAEAANGREALAFLDGTPVPLEVLLTDWNMPGMSGLELVKEIRERPHLRTLPVIMVTTETEGGHVAAALQAGATEYLMKPFTRDMIAGKLRLVGLNV